MNDEERMAIEHLKNYPINWLIENVNESAIKIALNLIERQQKEIEELKEENKKYKNPPFFDEDEYTEKDKIKAKIEEYEKNKKILEERKNGVFYSVEEIDKVDRNIKFYDVMINEMQSLLEKE